MLRPHLQIQLLTAAARRVGAAGGGRSQRGSIALFLLVALAVTVGAVAIANSSSNNLLRSGFMGQGREARQVALDGAQTIIDELNRVPNRRLLVTAEAPTTWTTTDKNFQNLCPGGGTGPTAQAINLTRDSVAGTTNGGFRSVAGDNTRQFRLLSVQKFATKARNSGTAYREANINIKPPATGLPIDQNVGYIRLEVQGRFLRGGNVVSTATATREFEVVPKCCGQSFGLPVDPADTTRGAHGMDINKCALNDTSGSNGLLGVVFGIFGGGLYDSGNSASGYLRTTDNTGAVVPIDNVMCAAIDDGSPGTSGPLEDCTGTGNFDDTQVTTKDGNITQAITYNDFTKVLSFQQPATPITAGNLGNTITNLRVSTGATPAVQQSTDDGATYTDASYCRSYTIDGNLEYHCLLDTIQYSSNKSLTIDTTNGDINLYVTSNNKNAVSFDGSSFLTHVRGTPPVPPTSCSTQGNAYVSALSIYGTPTDVQPPVGTSSANDITSGQEISLQGGPALTGLFIWAPYSLVVAKGGGSADPNFCGRVWANNLQLAGNVKFETPPTSGAQETGGGGGTGNPTENLIDWVARSISDLRLY